MKKQFEVDLPERLSTKSDFEMVLNYFLSTSWEMKYHRCAHTSYNDRFVIECTDVNKKNQFEELKRYIADQKADFIQVDYIELLEKK